MDEQVSPEVARLFDVAWVGEAMDVIVQYAESKYKQGLLEARGASNSALWDNDAENVKKYEAVCKTLEPVTGLARAVLAKEAALTFADWAGGAKDAEISRLRVALAAAHPLPDFMLAREHARAVREAYRESWGVGWSDFTMSREWQNSETRAELVAFLTRCEMPFSRVAIVADGGE